MTDDTDPARAAASPAVRLRRLVRAHRPFLAVLAVAAALRVVVMLGYPPAMFFNDSYNYMTDAVTRSPDIVRSDGYPLFLYILLPFHSLDADHRPAGGAGAGHGRGDLRRAAPPRAALVGRDHPGAAGAVRRVRAAD